MSLRVVALSVCIAKAHHVEDAQRRVRGPEGRSSSTRRKQAEPQACVSKRRPRAMRWSSTERPSGWRARVGERAAANGWQARVNSAESRRGPPWRRGRRACRPPWYGAPVRPSASRRGRRREDRPVVVGQLVGLHLVTRKVGRTPVVVVASRTASGPCRNSRMGWCGNSRMGQTKKNSRPRKKLKFYLFNIRYRYRYRFINL